MSNNYRHLVQFACREFETETDFLRNRLKVNWCHFSRGYSDQQVSKNTLWIFPAYVNNVRQIEWSLTTNKNLSDCIEETSWIEIQIQRAWNWNRFVCRCEADIGIGDIVSVSATWDGISTSELWSPYNLDISNVDNIQNM